MEATGRRSTEFDDSLRKIVWIASYPKSGNTWMRTFIQAYMTGHTCKLAEPFRVVRSDTNFAAYQSISPVSLPDDRPQIGMGLRFAAMLSMIEQYTGNDPILKTHNLYASNPEGLHLCPPSLTKKALYMIRDPRDVVVSFSHHLSCSIDETIDLMCNKNAHLRDERIGFGHHLSSWSNHASSWIAEDKPFYVATVRYEGSLGDPLGAFRKVVDFLFGEVKDDILEFAVRESSFSRLQKQEEEHGFNEQKGDSPFFRVGKAGNWKNILSDAQVEKLELGLGEAMERMGYECVTRSFAAA